MLSKTTLFLLVLLLLGCGTAQQNDQSNQDDSTDHNTSESPVHHDITVTAFWIGEAADDTNGYIPNLASAWDDLWMQHFGGIDAPDKRDGLRPSEFVPAENPFYFALPYNDFDENGVRKMDENVTIPWATELNVSTTESYCKNRWIRIDKGGKSVYAQWEDVGPFNENDAAYVFGDAQPANAVNDHAGLDVSPAVRDYLGLSDIDAVDWHFVDESEVPDGPWKKTVTASGIDWKSWWQPEADTTWQWQLTGELDTAFDVDSYDIDLFETAQQTIDTLHAQGRKVICYFSAGSYEAWRPDADRFPEEALGNDLDGWEGERWLDIRSEALKPIMLARLDLAVSKKCDAVEPDNVDAYTNETGFALSAADQLAWNQWLSLEAHERELSIALKNSGDQATELQPFFDFVLIEQCHKYDECALYRPFIDAGKPVFNAEYARPHADDDAACAELCRLSREAGLQTLVLPLEFDGRYRYSCEQTQ